MLAALLAGCSSPSAPAVNPCSALAAQYDSLYGAHDSTAVAGGFLLHFTDPHVATEYLFSVQNGQCLIQQEN